MGKNTMMKRFIRVHAEKIGNRDLLNPIPLLQGNVGLVFTKGDLKEVKDEVAKYKFNFVGCNSCFLLSVEHLFSGSSFGVSSTLATSRVSFSGNAVAAAG
ncbi:hypothetical protein PTKIN_Ptkin13bG0020900 [Pterospermum kingtungense]